MAVAFQSVQTASTSGTSITITKPTGLAVGDLMIAHLVATGSVAQETATFSKTGWNADTSTGVGNAGANTCVRNFVLSKVADSSDVAAANFVFTCSASMSLYGAIYRITGQHTSTPLSIHNQVAETGVSSPWSPAIPVTTTEANSLLLFLVGTASNSNTFSDYAVATNNPSWTEDYDSGPYAGAHATYAPAGSTGNPSLTVGTVGNGDFSMILLVVRPTIDVTISPTVVSITMGVQAPTVSTGNNISVSVISITMGVQAPTVGERVGWTNTDKSAAPTWTNQDKSTT